MSNRTLRQTSNRPKTDRELADEARLQALQHGSVAAMLETIFIECADRSHEGERHWADNLWEGLAVVARYMERDSDQLCELLDRIDRSPVVAKDGASS